MVWSVRSAVNQWNVENLKMEKATTTTSIIADRALTCRCTPKLKIRIGRKNNMELLKIKKILNTETTYSPRWRQARKILLYYIHLHRVKELVEKEERHIDQPRPLLLNWEIPHYQLAPVQRHSFLSQLLP